MSRKDAAAEHARLVEEISAHDIAYHQADAPTISDAEYDKLRLRLLELEKQYPTLAKSSPSAKVGAAPSEKFTKVRHVVPMLSLSNAFADEEVEEFLGRMAQYGDTRDFPAVRGPSYLGVHLRFGTVSIRRLAAAALAQHKTGSQGAAVWLSELIWRDFYAQILGNFPHCVGSAFKPEYDAIAWGQGEQAQQLFAAWCEGRTGYPLVDAAMAQINQTGYMHNRLRMVTASFLVKDLGIDWRWGERYFAEKLNDFDLSANNGGWQWAASTGCDAQPYFRIFNPISQSLKFDAEGRFIRRYVPALAALPAPAVHSPWLAQPLELAAAGVVLGQNYPLPIVQHDEARALTLQRYAVVKKTVA